MSANKKNVHSTMTAKKRSLPKKQALPKKRALPKWIWICLGIILIAFVAAALLMRPGSKADSMPLEISVVQAAEKRAAGAFILDVREQDEWNEVHIPDATLIPLGQLGSRLNEVPRDQDVVVVCRSGNRSKTGRDILLQAGYENVASMNGGMREWQAQGFPTASGQ